MLTPFPSKNKAQSLLCKIQGTPLPQKVSVKTAVGKRCSSYAQGQQEIAQYITTFREKKQQQQSLTVTQNL